MAIILRGKKKGQKITISQMCNDWITSEEYGQPINPTSLSFSVAEMERLINEKTPGMFWYLYHFEGNRLKRNKHSD